MSDYRSSTVHFPCFLAGDELADNFIEDAAVFVFEVFGNTKQIGEKEARRIRDAFGPYPASVASKAFSVVQRLKKACGDKSFFDESQTAAKVRKKFGSEIPFSFHGEIQCVISRPCKSGDADDYDSISEDEADLMQHMMQLTDDIMSKRSNGEIPTNDIQKGKTPTDPNTTGYDGKWLQNVCHICCGEARTWKELYTLVFDTLSLSVESERIQEEVCTMYIRMCIYIHTYVCVHMYVRMCTYVRMYVYVCTYVCVRMYVDPEATYVYTGYALIFCVCMCISTYVRTCKYNGVGICACADD